MHWSIATGKGGVIGGMEINAGPSIPLTSKTEPPEDSVNTCP